MKDAILRLSVYDYGSTRASIDFGFGCKKWSITNYPYFSSQIAAENQAKKLAEKFGFNIIETIID